MQGCNSGRDSWADGVPKGTRDLGGDVEVPDFLGTPEPYLTKSSRPGGAPALRFRATGAEREARSGGRASLTNGLRVAGNVVSDKHFVVQDRHGDSVLWRAR